MEPRIGVYICHCGNNIAGTVDVEAVTQFAQGLDSVVAARNYKFTCSEPGQNIIKEDIKDLGINRVVVASCSPTMHEPTFRRCCQEAGLNPYLFEMANIRDQCSWVTEDKQLATEKAKALVSGAVHRVYYHQPLESREVPVNPNTLVVGGGIAGIQAALTVANSEHTVYLVERDPSIGGHMAQLDKTFPTLDCSACILTPRMTEVRAHPYIELLTYSETEEVSGYVGNFKVKIRKKARSVDLNKCTGCEECANNCLVQYKVYPPEEVAEPELSPEDLLKVEDILNGHRGKMAPLIGVLQDINEQFRYLPAPVLHYVSRNLDIPLAHILKVATFYSLFSLKPRGEHLINVCQGTACFVRGIGRVLEELEKELGIKPGEVTEDGKYSLETVRCIGCCALAPCIRIDQDVHAKIRPARVRDILGGY